MQTKSEFQLAFTRIDVFDGADAVPPDNQCATANVTAYWIHFAGGAISGLTRTARSSASDLPIEVYGCAMPAREDLSDVFFETSINEMAVEMAEAICRQRKQRGDSRPFVLIGHSFGSVLAYRIAAELVSRGDSPARLTVVSFPAADQMTHDDSLHLLSDEALIEKVDQLFGGVPPEILNDPDSQKLFTPALRFDLGMLERYQHDGDHEKLSIPITAICGTDDRAVDLAQMQRWSRMTSQDFRLRAMLGDHFFPAERMADILRIAAWEWLQKGQSSVSAGA